ncbi:MAG: hypothetical protein ACREBH_02330 [Candidatus Micrarchaeaceae archaeon]
MATYAKFILLAVSVLGLFGTLVASQAGGAGTGSSAVAAGATNAICTVFNTVREIIFLLGLTLMILGGALYAGANIMPSQSKGGFQGYGMAMIIGGVVGVAIAVAAPFVLNLIVSAAGGSSVLTSTGQSGAVSLCAGIA